MEDKSAVILIVEDDDPSYLYLETILKHLPAFVLRAENGQEAIDYVTHDPGISIVLMDLKMPVMDGLDATRKIKSIRKKLPIIAITAYAFSSDEKIAMSAGCDDYLTKPVKKELLFKKLEAHGIPVNR
jgi:CheY-like chemotaxis protein